MRRPDRESSCDYRLVEPGRKYFLPGFAGSGSEFARLIAKPTRIDAGFAEFDGVTDEPGFEAHRLGLEMKLQAELSGRSREGLHRAMLRRNKLGATRRQFAIVAVPMQHWRRPERREQRFFSFGGQLQRRPADLLDRPRRDAGAERRRH